MDAARALALGMKRLRQRHGLSQGALAERTGLSVGYVASLEQMKKTPALATLDALAHALRVSVSELFAAGESQRSGGALEDVAALLEGLDRTDRQRVLTIVREACALARPPRQRR